MTAPHGVNVESERIKFIVWAARLNKRLRLNRRFGGSGPYDSPRTRNLFEGWLAKARDKENANG